MFPFSVKQKNFEVTNVFLLVPVQSSEADAIEISFWNFFPLFQEEF